MNDKTYSPSPKITRHVFQILDDHFDGATHLYKGGWTDTRVAQEANTTEDIVRYLRKETFGELAEDPRFTALRDDIELWRLEAADLATKMASRAADLKSRLDQIAMSTKLR